MIKTLLVDENQVFTFGLNQLFAKHGGFAVVGECRSSTEVGELVEKTRPDIVLMDMHLSDGDGVEACQKIVDSYPDARIVFLTTVTDEEQIFAAIMAGASGYLLKNISTNELLSALEKVNRGESLLDPAITGKVMRKMQKLVQGESGNDLTDQDKRILVLVAEGKTNREIGAIMSLSENTIKNYVSSIFSKCGFNNRAEAAVFAAKNLLARQKM